MTKLIKRKHTFDGGKITYYSVPILYAIFFMLARTKTKSTKNLKEILYIYREWGRDTYVIEATLESLTRCLGEKRLKQVCIGAMDSIRERISEEIETSNKFSHILLDVRAMIDSAFWYQIPKLLLNSALIARACSKKGITILCQSPDFNQPSDRLLSAILTINNGMVLSLATIPNLVFFPHNRVLWPMSPPPLAKTFCSIEKIAKEYRRIDINMGGTLYEPRKSFYKSIYTVMNERKYNCFFIEKKEISTYDEYISHLQESKIVVLTTCYSGDAKLRQLQGKVMEAAAAGSLLFVQDCQSVREIFNPWEEYVPFDSLDDIDGIMNLLIYYLENEEERAKIALAGYQRMRDYVEKNEPWANIIGLQ